MNPPEWQRAWPAPSGYQFVCAYEYVAENGKVVMWRVRFHRIDPNAAHLRPKEFRPFWPDPTGRKEFLRTKPAGARNVVYRLPEVIKAAETGIDVWWCEGEKDADAGRELGLVTTTAGSSGARLPDDLHDHVRGIPRLFVVPDNDESGRSGASRVAAAAAPFVGDVRIVELPGLPEGGDLSDYLARGHTADDLWALAEGADSWRPPTEPEQQEAERSAPSIATELVDLAEDASLFHTPGDQAWASLPWNSHLENHAVSSRRFASWLRRRYYAKTRRPPPAAAVADAIASIEARALYDSPERAVHLRVGAHEGAIVLDLGRDSWEVVVVDSNGWHVRAESPIAFRRPPGLKALPLPSQGGDLDELLGLLNVEGEAVPLVLGYLVACLRPSGPYPILDLHGEQGSAKSTLARMLRGLVDPSTSPARSAPKDERDLAIGANSAWLLCYDNLSHLAPWLSDALCRISTGGGFATRALYTNDEEAIFDASRPVILNGIEELAQRPDLLDRSLMVRCPVIPENRRRDEHELWEKFDEAAPRLLGCLLDAVSTGLRRLPEVELREAPRLADFARFAVACEPALGLAHGEFLEAYRGNRAEAHELALDAAPIAEPLRRLLHENGVWEGTYSELLGALAERAGSSVAQRKTWPASARGLSNQLRRLQPNLRAVGVEIEGRGRRAGHGGALVALRLGPGAEVPARPSQPSQPSRLLDDQGELL